MAHVQGATATAAAAMNDPVPTPVASVAAKPAAGTGAGAGAGAGEDGRAYSQRPRNRIQVSREKRPLYFFIGLAKKFLTSEEEVELSGLGLAVTTVVTVAEILKNSGHVTISRIHTSLVEMPVEQRAGANAETRATTPKAKIQIWIKKSDQFESLTQYVDHTKKGARKNGKHKNAPTPAPQTNADANGSAITQSNAE